MFGLSVASLLRTAGQHNLFQAVSIVLGTFILEDAATVLAAMQAETGALPIWLALLSLYVGIVLGVSLRVGKFLMDHFGVWRWVGAIGFAVVIVGLGWVAGRLNRGRFEPRGQAGHGSRG